MEGTEFHRYHQKLPGLLTYPCFVKRNNALRMQPTARDFKSRPRIKICCIKSSEEAALAISCGASALGFVAAMPSGPGVVHVFGTESVDYATSAARYVDALLLDSGDPRLTTKELGGTGRVHDWALSRWIRDSISIPLFLAGGLHAGNVAEAIATVQPFGLDLCSGVRTNDKLDAIKLKALFAAIGQAV
jgi:phosphoribosylanthranilate isomerase